MAVSKKMAVFWVVALCSLVKVYQRFRDPCCLHHQGDDYGGSKAARTSEMSTNPSQTTRRYTPEDSHLSYSMFKPPGKHVLEAVVVVILRL
jgi:hypothetical protein